MRSIPFCLTALFAIGCGTSVKDQMCARNRATTSVDFVCSSDDDCCSGWKCMSHERNDGKITCALQCAANSDCTVANGAPAVRNYCDEYSWGTICSSVPPGIGGGGNTGNCCGDGFCCPTTSALCCGSTSLGTSGVCCPRGYSRGVGNCDLDPPCYTGNAEAEKHCSGVTYNGQVVYSELCN